MKYTVRKATSPLPMDWDSPAWADAEVLEVANFRPESSGHRPRTLARVLHANRQIHGQFRVEDRYVHSTRVGYGTEVWKDACVEFFVEPRPGQGYFNFEFNCGGSFLCNHIVDPARAPGGFKDFTRIPVDVAGSVTVKTSMPPKTDPELIEPVTWFVRFTVPVTVLEMYVGTLGDLSGQVWRGNFFKCAEDNSHPHWAAWSPVDEFNFHLPRCFGEIAFE